MMKTFLTPLKLTIPILLGLLLITQSALAPGNKLEQVRAHTRMIEFDFIEWTIDALRVKNAQESLRAPRYMSLDDQRKVVAEYLRLVRLVNQTTADINRIYANPDIQNPDEAAAELNDRLEAVRTMERDLKPLAESILQYQVSTTIADMGLAFGGQPLPPVLYHVTRLPTALIVSPRDVIRQDANISLKPDLTPEEIAELERAVEADQNVSALVVPIGGVGTYPTMVMSTTDLIWLTEVIAHEWVHNYLTLRPVGALYMASGEMRTINETTANIAGKEIGRALIERYYPDLVPYLPPPLDLEPEEEDKEETQPPEPAPEEDPDTFNFNREMHKTRVQTDALLGEGKIEEAEAYMEARRRFFWENGYQIRRLNQAYFAFYGAYADSPGGGAAGKDPVGPAVQELRRRSPSLAEFISRISWVTSFEQLQALLNQDLHLPEP